MKAGVRKKTMTYLEAAKAVLEEMKQPMHFRKITELAMQKRYLLSQGKTPVWTMGARLSVDVKEKGARSEFIRVDSGRYGLRRWRKGKTSLSPAGSPVLQEGPSYWLVSVDPSNFAHDERAGTIDTIGVKLRMRKTLAELQPGDRVAIYLKRAAVFAGVVEVSGGFRTDSSPRWPVEGETLAARVACKPLVILEGEAKLDARPLYSQLEVFLQYPAKHRTLALRNGITQISGKDYGSIEAAVLERSKSDG